MLRAMLILLLAVCVPLGSIAPVSAQAALAAAVPAYADDTTWRCVSSNPSCARDPWWLERNELQGGAKVTYQAIGEAFATERSFIEAVNLLWQWPEGKRLLRQANGSGATVMSLAYDVQYAFATFLPDRGTIAVNQRFVTAPIWMLADVLAHELSHTADSANGIRRGSGEQDCFARELEAFQVEQRFLVWLTRTLRPEGLPAVEVVSAQLSTDHANLARQVYTRGLSTDLPRLVADIYADVCTT